MMCILYAEQHRVIEGLLTRIQEFRASRYQSRHGTLDRASFGKQWARSPVSFVPHRYLWECS